MTVILDFEVGICLGISIGAALSLLLMLWVEL